MSCSARTLHCRWPHDVSQGFGLPSCACRCLAIMSLKLFFEYTLAGRRWSLAKQINLDVSVHSLPGISHVTSVTGAAAEDMWRAAVDRSIRGGTIMQSPSLELQQDVNASKHGSFSHSHVEVQCNGSDCTHAQEVL